MTIHYRLSRPDRPPVEITADPRNKDTRRRLAAAVVELAGPERARVHVSSSLIGPVHIATPINAIIGEIEAARAGKAVRP